MKNLYLLISILLGTVVLLNAQPTLSYENNAPLIGDVYYQSYSNDQVLAGPQGPNKTWDFSDVSVYETGETVAIDPASTPFADIFTEANISFNYNTTSAFNYSEINQNEGFNWGTGFDNTPSMVIYYDDPVKLISYPFSYQDEFTDIYHGDYEYQQLYTRTTGVLTKTADAWGTITTPAGTFENVLRLKTIRDHVDSIWMGDIFIQKTVISYEDYEWYTSDSHIPIFAITYTSSLLVNDTVSYFVTGTTNISEMENWETGLYISPNPANEYLNITYFSSEVGETNISLIDLHGREIKRNCYFKNSDKNMQIQINIKEIKAGIYFIKAVQDSQVEVRKLIIK